MKIIWKFPIELTDEQRIEIPAGSKILSAQVQNGQICIWAIVDDSEVETEYRPVAIVGTGNKLWCFDWEFVGTVQQGDFVWHIFIKQADVV